MEECIMRFPYSVCFLWVLEDFEYWEKEMLAFVSFGPVSDRAGEVNG